MTTTIEWTDTTWNPVTGCDRVSPGCDNCYALTLAKRLKAMGQAKYQNDGDPRTSGPGFGLTMHPDTLDAPDRWRKPRMVFVNSMSDLFHPRVHGRFIVDVIDTIANSYRHTFQVLTKRPQRMERFMRRYYAGAYIEDPAAGPLLKGPITNLWLGTSIETSRYAFRAGHLRATPAAVRFLSCEPLIGPLGTRLELLALLEGINWVIVGAESGRGARPMEEQWARDIKDACQFLEIPFFFKQAATAGGHKIPLPELDGRQWTEMPA